MGNPNGKNRRHQADLATSSYNRTSLRECASCLLLSYSLRPNEAKIDDPMFDTGVFVALLHVLCKAFDRAKFN